MKNKFVKQIQETLKDSYSAIAGEFDQTRKVPWGEFNHFLAYTKHGGHTLDVGCGNGRFYEFLKPKKVDYWGVDHNSNLLDHAQKNYPEAKFDLQDMMNLELPRDSFDNIFCIAAYHHVPGKKMRKQVSNDFHDLLKPDGVLILTVWNLFQKKYFKNIMHAIGRCILHLGFRYQWNDLWVKWGTYPIKRYYHAFLTKELLSYFPDSKWQLEEFYFTRKGKRVSFWRSYNLVLIVRKK